MSGKQSTSDTEPAAAGGGETVVRPETAADRAAVRTVNEAAFGQATEAALVDALREQAQRVISLVAEIDGTVVGHILFSPVSLAGRPDLEIAGLAPMAVLPAYQGRGAGTALVAVGLEKCREAGYGAVVVLGHAGYYPRFGFEPAIGRGIDCEYGVPADAFMYLELRAGYLEGASGTIRYHPAFAAAEGG